MENWNSVVSLPPQTSKQMVVVAQLVRASVCGAEGRGFEPHHPPKSKSLFERRGFFCAFNFGEVLLDQVQKGSGTKVGDYPKRLDNLNRKKSIFLTPLN